MGGSDVLPAVAKVLVMCILVSVVNTSSFHSKIS